LLLLALEGASSDCEPGEQTPNAYCGLLALLTAATIAILRVLQTAVEPQWSRRADDRIQHCRGIHPVSLRKGAWPRILTRWMAKPIKVAC